MNAKSTTDLDVEVYVNRGWDSLQLYKKIDQETMYTVHVKMAKAEGTIYKGDVIVFDNEDVVAFIKGVAVSQPMFIQGVRCC